MPEIATRVVTAKDNFRIRPEDINASRHFFGAFDQAETEISAGWIVRFIQVRGTGWEPFTYEDINAFYAKKYSNGFRFNRLVEPEMVPPSLARAFAGYHDERIPVGGGWIILKDGRYYVTDDFILRCYKSSPTVSVAKDAEQNKGESAERIRNASEHGG